MRLHRFFIDRENQLFNFNLSDEEILISDQEIINQWVRVFRYSSGKRVILFDGSGFDYTYEMTNISSKNIELSFVEKNKNIIKNKKLNLIFSIIKKQNSELLIQKCTEIGISSFQPIISERTEKKNFDIDRAKKIAIEAVEQSGRDSVPNIGKILEIEKFLENYFSNGNTLKSATYIFDINGVEFTIKDLNKIHSLLDTDQQVFILFGP